MRIVVVEDDAGTRSAVKRVAAHTSPTVFDAENGLDALAIIDREDPDLVITDLGLPLMDGFELIAALRESPAHRRLPVICLSATNIRSDIERLTRMGISDYLLKPLNPMELDERIRKVLRKQANWRADRAREMRTDRVPQVLIIDPDPNYRAFVRPLLEPDYEVIEMSGAAQGLAAFKSLEVKPEAVFIADDVPMLRSWRVAELIEALCDESSAALPPTLLLSDSDRLDRIKAHRFAGVVRRSFVPDLFLKSVRRWLPRKQSPADRVRAQVAQHGGAWLKSATRQTIGVLSAQDAIPVDQGPADVVEVTGSIEIDVAQSGCKVQVFVGCSIQHVTSFASAVLKREATLETGAPDILGEFVNTVGGRMKATLIEKGFTLKLGLPTIEVAGFNVARGDFESKSWMRSDAGEFFFIGLGLIEDKGFIPPPSDHAAPDAAAAAATSPGESAGVASGGDDMDDVLF